MDSSTTGLIDRRAQTLIGQHLPPMMTHLIGLIWSHADSIILRDIDKDTVIMWTNKENTSHLCI